MAAGAAGVGISGDTPVAVTTVVGVGAEFMGLELTAGVARTGAGLLESLLQFVSAKLNPQIKLTLAKDGRLSSSIGFSMDLSEDGIWYLHNKRRQQETPQTPLSKKWTEAARGNKFQ